MPRITFDELPDHGRLWVFPASRDLTISEAETFMGAVDAFLDRWAAHGVPLRSGRELRDNRFLVVGVDVDAEAPSGCSIDALVNQLRQLGKELGVTVVDHSMPTAPTRATMAPMRADCKFVSISPPPPRLTCSLGSFHDEPNEDVARRCASPRRSRIAPSRSPAP